MRFSQEQPDIDLDYVEYMPGRSVPRYVERLDEVEWVTDRRAERSPLPTILAALAVVIGVVAVVIGLSL